jgi:uncharacterized repeat protein (TIGR01451 family)
MKKIKILMVSLILVGAVFISGCVQESTDDGSTPPTTEITLDEAIAILMSILDPSSSDSRISAFMLSEPLRTSDTVTSEGGDSYPLDGATWFAFIDDEPKLLFTHPTRYVLIDGQDGSYEIVNEIWPPLVNDYSMWDIDNLNRGEVIEFYPLLNMSMPITLDGQSSAPSGDYGDAPDGTDAYYGVEGKFPTYYATSNSILNRPGGHTLNVGEETLGLNVSAEVDADDPNDPDLIPNLVDSDSDERMFVYINVQNAQLSFTVTVSETALEMTRYVNVLIDFDQDGNWTEGSYGNEWAVTNLEVDVPPGSTEIITTPSFSWGNNALDLPTPAWMRVALTREEINESLFTDIGGWDGSGQFEYGEIEDHLVYLIDNPPDPEDEWPPGEPKEPTDPQPPGPSEGPCGTDVNYHSIIISGGDSSKHMKRGRHPADQAVDTMTDLLNDQGYNSVGSLTPGGSGGSSNSISSITAAFETLKSQVKCGDHVLIYIVGHGNSADNENGPGINMKGTNGKNSELLTPSTLSSLLAKIPACEDQLCDDEEVNCHVNVVIESCYAGSFNIDGVKGPGRTVMGSSSDEPASAAGGGVFTSGFNDSSRSEGSDANDDGVVSPAEAFDIAKNSVDKNNAKPSRKNKEDQEPWKDSQECECRCPNNPSVTGGKYAWDGTAWVDEVAVSVGDTVMFKLELENDGGVKNVENIRVVDSLPSGLSYVSGSGVLYQNGENLGLRNYCNIMDGTSGVDYLWVLTEIAYLAPGETIAIEYSATALSDGTYTNSYYGYAYCSEDTSILVSCEDTAVVTIS